tara:strand:- start:520 stop:1605 length:1086 start_codon:yes stop_codon:yes gene_type:complete
MKITEIKGCGRFGVFIDDVDFYDMSEDQWMEIGQIHLDSLVTIIRDTGLEKYEYVKYMNKWGLSRMTFQSGLAERYPNWDGHLETITEDWNPEDVESVKTFLGISEKPNPISPQYEIIRVQGGKDDHGNPKGMFADGELLWHSNESGNIAFTPGVALLAYENTTKSCTGFLTTVDYYESVSDSFRRELDQMILIHNFIPGKINPGLNGAQDNVMYKNMVPVADTKMPMVIRSPAGHAGLHYSFNTVTGIEGMSDKEAKKVLMRIKKELEVEEYIYDHWYKQDGDLCLFDNSVTQHRRLGETDGRLCLRYQYDFSNLQTDPWMPYFQQPYINLYCDEIDRVMNPSLPNRQEFKLPNKNNYSR